MRRSPLFALVGGWGPRGFTAYLSRALALHGYDSLEIKPPSRKAFNAPPWPGFPQPMARLARAINSELLGRSTPRVVIAHSMGCIASLIAALNGPDQLPKAIVLVNPAGFMRSDNVLALAWRSNRKTAHSMSMALRNRSLLRPTLTSLWQNLLYTLVYRRRALQEALSIPHCVSDVWIQEVRALGVKVYAVLAEDDLIFPLDKCRWLLSQLDGFEIIAGQHDLWYDTEALLLAIGRMLGPELFFLAPEGSAA